MKWNKFALLALLNLGVAGACSAPPSDTGSTGNPAPASNVSVIADKNDYPVFPNADAGADPSVSAELGGKGFTGLGWETNDSYELIGDPHAVKGGTYRDYISDFPGTLRLGGPEWITSVNFLIGSAVYETLLAIDPTTLDYIPQLATHWQKSPDHMTYRFRIDPNARWSDGRPVIADDVVATWVFYTDKTLQDPAMSAQFMKLEKPVAESKYIVSVRAKTLDWKHFLNFATFMPMFPAHVLRTVDGAAYIRDYNFRYLPNSGPYIVRDSDIQKGRSITLRRRSDYWGSRVRRNVGLNNFDVVRLDVVRDPNLAFEMFKKGELDTIGAGAQTWVERLNFDTVQRGLIQKQKVFNSSPRGYNGFALNTRREPFDDIRVRKAFTVLLNRELMIEKLFFNEYRVMNSYYSGTTYENTANPRNTYDPQLALALLTEAGWRDRDTQGRLVKNGRPLSVELLYDSKQSETYLTVFQDDLRKIGINVNLRLTTPVTRFKLMTERQFDMVETGWGAGAFPDPEGEFHSRLADVANSYNVTGFKDPRIDELCEKYARTFDQDERVALMQQLDGILTNEYHYILKWYSPAHRIAYWNKFGYPAAKVTRTGLVSGDLNLGPGIERRWWIDPAKSRLLDQARTDASLKVPVEAVEDYYWQRYRVPIKR